MALLFAFQRFSLEAWGVVCDFKPCDANGAERPNPSKLWNKFTITYPENGSVDVDASHPLYKNFILIGRATQVFRAERLNLPNKSDKNFVVKVSWVDESRIPEPKLVEKVVSKGEGDERIQGHMPNIVAWMDHGRSTSTIRQLLNIDSLSHEAQRGSDRTTTGLVLRSIVSEELQPLEKLTGEQFFNAYFDIITRMYSFKSYCHHHSKDLFRSSDGMDPWYSS